jgi:hypothetical protein
MKRAAIFETTLEDYLTQIGDIDLPSRAEVLGASASDGALTLPLYGMPHRVSKEGVFDAGGQKANFTVSVVLCRYILQCPAAAPAPGGWVTYREFRDAAPLTGYFTTNTKKIIETTFAGRLSVLEEACRRIRGSFADTSSFDLAVVFDFLPRIPVYLRFNDRDDEFPAQSSFLFRRSAERYLDMECLAIGGTLLAGLLISEAKG